MATTINWTPRAENDLKNIYDYIARDSDFYATRFINALISSVTTQLSIFPLSGRKIPELEQTKLDFLREVIYKSYRVIYDPTKLPLQVDIIAVQSARMDFGKQSRSWEI